VPANKYDDPKYLASSDSIASADAVDPAEEQNSLPTPAPVRGFPNKYDDPKYDGPPVAPPEQTAEDFSTFENFSAGTRSGVPLLVQSGVELAAAKERLGKFEPQNYMSQEQKDKLWPKPSIWDQIGQMPGAAGSAGIGPPVATNQGPSMAERLRALTPDQRKQRDKDMFTSPEYQQLLAMSKSLGEQSQRTMAGHEDSTMAGLGQAGTGMVPSIAVGALTGGAGLIAGLGTMGVQVYGNALAEGREMGLDEETNQARAVLTSLSETAPEVLPFGHYIGKLGGKSFLKNWAIAGLTEGPSEAITEIMQIGMDKGLYGPDASPKQAFEALTSPEGIAQIIQAGKMGVFMGLMLGGPGAKYKSYELKKEAKGKADTLRSEMEAAAEKVRAEGLAAGKSEIEALIDVNMKMMEYDTQVGDADRELEMHNQVSEEILNQTAAMEQADEKNRLKKAVDEGYAAQEDEARTRLAQETIAAENQRQLQIGTEPAPLPTTKGDINRAGVDAEQRGSISPINPAMAQAMIAAGIKPSRVMAQIDHERSVEAENTAAKSAPIAENTSPAVEPDAVMESQFPGSRQAEAQPVARQRTEQFDPETRTWTPLEAGKKPTKGFQTRKIDVVPEAAPEPTRQLPTREQLVAKEAKVAAIDEAAHEAATSLENDLPQPTDAQKSAGNYTKGHVNVQGLDVTIENPVGSERSGTRADGTPWKTTIANHYGYIRRTDSAEGNDEQLDVFLGDNPDAGTVFVVDQVNQKTGVFDEHKAMVGFNSNLEAIKAYKKNYQPGWKVGKVTAMPMAEFKAWSQKKGNKNRPLHVGTPIGEVASPADVEALSGRLSKRRIRRSFGKVLSSRSLSDGRTMVHSDDRGHHTVEVNDNVTGKKIGKIDAMETRAHEEAGKLGRPTKRGLLRVMRSDVFDEADRGKGHGLHMYNHLLQVAHKAGRALASDISVSPGAARVYRALQERGASVKVNPHTINPTTGAMVSTDVRVPVFEVEPTVIKLRMSDMGGPAAEELTQDSVQKMVDTMSRILSIDNVVVMKDVPAADQERNVSPNAAGAYFSGDNQVKIYWGNLQSLDDVVSTVLHESVAHMGLRYLLPAQEFNDLMMSIYNNMSQNHLAEWTAFMKDAGYKGENLVPAVVAEEYVAFVAESGDTAGTLQKVYDAVRKAFRRLGVVNNWTDNDIRALLRETRQAIGKTRPLENIEIEYIVKTPDGAEFTVSMNAERALRQHDKRASVIEKLKDCVKS